MFVQDEDHVLFTMVRMIKKRKQDAWNFGTFDAPATQ